MSGTEDGVERSSMIHGKWRGSIQNRSGADSKDPALKIHFKNE